MLNERTVETEKTVTVKTFGKKDDGGYDNLEVTRSEYADNEKSTIKTFKSKPVRYSQLQEETYKDSQMLKPERRPLKDERTSKFTRGRADPFEASPSSAAGADDKKPPESDAISDYGVDVLPKRESTSFDKNKKNNNAGEIQRQTSSVPTEIPKKKKTGCCTLL